MGWSGKKGMSEGLEERRLRREAERMERSAMESRPKSAAKTDDKG
jgi:hypothetical protein